VWLGLAQHAPAAHQLVYDVRTWICARHLSETRVVLEDVLALVALHWGTACRPLPQPHFARRRGVVFVWLGLAKHAPAAHRLTSRCTTVVKPFGRNRIYANRSFAAEQVPASA